MPDRITPEDDPLAWCQPDPSAGFPLAKRIVLYFDPERWETGAPCCWVWTWCQCETGIPEPEYHGRWLAWTLSPRIDAAALTRRLNAGEAGPFLAQIAAGFRIDWDGHTWRGVLNGDGISAVLGFREWLHDVAKSGETAGLWDAADWFTPGEPLPVTAETGDDGIERIAEQIEAAARAEYGAVLVGTAAYLRQVRARLREEAGDVAR